jgi:hypothetical protein
VFLGFFLLALSLLSCGGGGSNEVEYWRRRWWWRSRPATRYPTPYLYNYGDWHVGDAVSSSLCYPLVVN